MLLIAWSKFTLWRIVLQENKKPHILRKECEMLEQSLVIRESEVSET